MTAVTGFKRAALLRQPTFELGARHERDDTTVLLCGQQTCCVMESEGVVFGRPALAGPLARYVERGDRALQVVDAEARDDTAHLAPQAAVDHLAVRLASSVPDVDQNLRDPLLDEWRL